MANSLAKRMLGWFDARGFGPLQLRAMLVVSAALTALAFTMLAGDIVYSTRSVERELLEQATATARTISALTADRLSTGKLTSVVPIVSTMVQYGTAESIEIIDVPAAETLHVERSHFRLEPSLSEQDLQLFKDHGKDRASVLVNHIGSSLEVLLPLYVDEELRGLVRAVFNNEFPAVKRHETIERVMITGGVFLAAILPFFSLMIGRILRPIRELTDAARQMTRGGVISFSHGLRRDDEIGRLARSFKRMTAHLARSMAEERRLAYVDPVTGLCNRERMRRTIEAIAAYPPHSVYERGLLFIDLDGFKQVNDMLGHDRGDRLLEAVGQRFQSICRTHDYQLLDPLVGTINHESHGKVARIGRLGGDEFVIVARFGNLDELLAFAQSIISELRKPFTVDGHPMEVGASIGIARFYTDGNDASTLMRHADLAMYEAKELGGGRYCLYSDEMGQRMLDRLILEMELRRAIGNDEIDPFFMPKIRLESGELYGFEVLARWNHPTRGLIRPDHFIPVAERTGIIADIDRIVLRKALVQARRWFDQGRPIPVAVNVSPIHLERADFIDHIESALTAARLPGYLLELEITETAAMKDNNNILQGLVRLKSHGIRIAIDDFGSGYSNLAQLHRVPADVIKIDGSLVRALGATEDGDLMIRTILTLAAQLGLEVVAEGIDTAAKHERLRGLGCGIGQGFLYAPPMPIAKTINWLGEKTVWRLEQDEKVA